MVTATLEELLARLAAQAALPPESALSLPPELYWRPDVYALERERIFARDWSCVGHVDQVRAPGDWLKAELAGEPLVIVRDAGGRLRALSRVCRHRSIDLLCESEGPQGNAERFECPYHLWSYALDGRLVGAPEMRGAAGFERASVRLPEFPLEVWQGYIFVCLDASAAPLAPRLAELEALLGKPDMSDWRIAGSLPWGDVDVNWKVVIENAAECYHHLGTHRGTLQPLWPAARAVVDETSSRDFTFGRLFTSESAASGVEDGFPIQPLFLPPLPGLSAERRAQTMIAAVFPMFFIAVAPDSATWFQWHPTGPTSHHVDIHVLVPPASLEAPGFAAGLAAQLEALRAIQAEDARTNAGVQRGLESRSAAPGRLSLLERPLWQLQRYLAERLCGAARPS
jgi:phenylpropionate dioxygenase-like ring-hydroxylating dioxygenase large terminal subunit